MEQVCILKMYHQRPIFVISHVPWSIATKLMMMEKKLMTKIIISTLVSFMIDEPNEDAEVE